MLPFTAEQFFAVFARYNDAIWPAQLVAYALGAVAGGLLLRPGNTADRVIPLILATMWAWTGIGYHWLSFTAINPAGAIFAVLFVLQAALLLHAGLSRQPLRFHQRFDVCGMVGLGLMAYAAILYPLVGYASGHAYPRVPTFGVTPCPVTIFTFGVLLLADRVPWTLMVIPVLWSLIGGSAAILLQVPQDWLLLLSGPIAAGLVWARQRAAAPA